MNILLQSPFSHFASNWWKLWQVSASRNPCTRLISLHLQTCRRGADPCRSFGSDILWFSNSKSLKTAQSYIPLKEWSFSSRPVLETSINTFFIHICVSMAQIRDHVRVNLPGHKVGLPHEEAACLAQNQSGVFPQNDIFHTYKFYFWNIQKFALI